MAQPYSWCRAPLSKDIEKEIIYDTEPRLTRLRLFDNDGFTNELRLFRVASLREGMTKGTWGLTIVRTDYNSRRAQIRNAVDFINDAVRQDLGATAPYEKRRVRARPRKPLSVQNEIFARYTSTNIQNPGVLHKASIHTIRNEFQKWIVENNGNFNGSDMRYVFCIILDEETVRKLNALMCEDQSRVGEATETRVKIKVLDAIPGSACTGVYQVNLRGKHGLTNFWFHRNLRRQPVEAFLSMPLGEHGQWCFGPQELAAATEVAAEKTALDKIIAEKAAFEKTVFEKPASEKAAAKKAAKKETIAVETDVEKTAET